jgi:NAD(P)-dependent dehydrogenase (short-subunit alcohol dehydrogenase family)
MLLENSNAVIYGAGGSIGGAVTREFAREGARVFLAGRTREKLERVARDIGAGGGSAEVAVVDALDERAVDEHTRDVVSQAGSIDVSFNLITRGDVQGIPMVDMATDDLLRAVVNGLRTNFMTARAAARHMVEKGWGVILALVSGSANVSPMMGSTGPADAATDTFIRNFAAEIGPRRVRVVGIWTAGLPETLSPGSLAPVGRGRGHRGLPGLRQGRRHHRHVRQRHQRDVPKLEERSRMWVPSHYENEESRE